MNRDIITSIDRYIDIDTPFPKIIVIYGPTASGKTTLSLEVAEYLGSEIISADSRQIYRGLDIGTGKIREAEMWWILHHMIDIIEASVTYSMVDFRKDVDALRIFESQPNVQMPNIPILCWGTWLYLDAILYDMDYPENPPDWTYREELEEIRRKEWNQKLWDMLYRVDPGYAKELIPENYRYIMRGLEVMRETGRSKKESQNTKTLRFSPLFLTTYSDSEENRKALYARIDTRVRKMFDDWLIEEVWYNIRKYGAHCPGLSTIGYKEVVEYLEWIRSLDETIALVAQHSRNYAKRQITWNKKYDSYRSR
jgi:tRNA dimethylallyltransferase